MPLPSIHRFYTEDYQGAPSWFQRFINTLNLFSDPVYQSLNMGLTFQSNLNAQVYTFTITAGASASANVVNFTKKINGQATGLLKIAANVSSNIATPITSAIDLCWYQDGNTIRITAISGLTSGTTYNITVLLF